MTRLLTKTLAQIVAGRDESAVVFEKYCLDYFCRGERLLDKACNENKVPVIVVEKALENIYSSPVNEINFDCFKLSQLADYIFHTHHAYAKKILPQIIDGLAEVCDKCGNTYPQLYKISDLFTQLSIEMTRHMHYEETILFSAIKDLEQHAFEPIPFDSFSKGYLRLPILNLKSEHNRAVYLMSEIKKLTANYKVPEAVYLKFRSLYTSFREFEFDLHRHIHLENNILFPKALALETNLKLNAVW